MPELTYVLSAAQSLVMKQKLSDSEIEAIKIILDHHERSEGTFSKVMEDNATQILLEFEKNNVESSSGSESPQERPRKK